MCGSKSFRYMFDEALLMKCCVSFTPDVMGIKSLVVDIIFLHLDGNHQLTFFFFLPLLNFKNYQNPAVFFWGGIFAESLIVKSWILTLTEASETFTFLDVVLGSFVTIETFFCRLATHRKVHHCSPFVDSSSRCSSLESQKWFCKPIMTDKCQWLCCLPVFGFL